MDRRLLLGVIVLAAALGLGGMAMLAPSTGGGEAARPPAPVAAAPAPSAAPHPAPPPQHRVGPGTIPQPTVTDDTGTLVPAAAPPPLRVAEPQFDLDQIYTPDLQGLGAAALGRRERILDCYGDYREEYGDVPGRLTVRMTVSRADDGGADLRTEMATAQVGAESFDACVSDAMADAAFDPPESGSVSMLWPVPMSSADRLP